jgi:hypothetical protein
MAEPFSYYLDAAAFCRRTGLPLSAIVRGDWRTWLVLPNGY